MSTAVDTNILLDVLLPDSSYVDQSGAALALAGDSGEVLISEPVYAELAGRLVSLEELDRFLERVGVSLERSTTEVLYVAGVAWRAYSRRRPRGLVCGACGTESTVTCGSCSRPLRARQHILSDFLIGAHADAYAGRLLTRDRGYYRTYFPQLELV